MEFKPLQVVEYHYPKIQKNIKFPSFKYNKLKIFNN